MPRHHANRRALTALAVLLATTAVASPLARADDAAAGPVIASVPQTIAFQGFLATPSGTPVNGTVSLAFNLYSTSSGGTSLWTETQSSVSVVNGVFAVNLGSLTPFPGGLFESASRFLGLRVDGEPELPRTQLRSSPFAFRAQSADTLSGEIRLRQGASSVVVRSEDSSNGRVLVFDNAFAEEALRIGSEFDGGGLLVMRAGGSQTVRLDGDAFGGCQLTLSGSGSSAVFATRLSGDPAVQLPQSGVAAPEILDEPGVASANNTSFVTLSGPTPQSVISRSITPPADGFVLALGQCATRITHTSGTGTSGAVGLSDDGVAFGAAQDVNVQISSTAPTGSYAIPAHVNGVFPVTGGVARTIHLVASETSGDIQLEDLSLTLLYVPTSYGTVSPTLVEPGSGTGEENRVSRGTQTSAEIAAERAESGRWNDERIARELALVAARQADMETEMAAMQEGLARVRETR